MIRTRRLWRTVFHLLAFAPIVLHAQPQASGSRPPGSVLNIVAMLNVVWSGSSFPRCGAGIVVGDSSDRVYVATAGHLLADSGSVDSVKRVELIFRGLPGEKFVGTKLSPPIEGYDLEVFVVRGLPRDVIAGFQYNVLPGDVWPDTTTNATIRFIGNPGCKPWESAGVPMPVTDWIPYVVAEGTLNFGLSGGGAFDTNWRLRGMALKDDGSLATALPIAIVTTVLKRRGIPVRLRRTDDSPPENQIENTTPADNRAGIFGTRIPVPVLNALRSRIRDGGHRITDIAFFGPSGYVLVEDQHTPRCENLPEEVTNALQEIVKRGMPIRRIVTNPSSPSSWLVLYGDNEWMNSPGLPPSLLDSLTAFHNWNRPIRDVTLLPEEGWLIIEENDSVVEVNGDLFKRRILDSGQHVSRLVVKDRETWFFLRPPNGGTPSGIGDDLSAALTAVRNPHTQIVTFAFTPAGGWILLTDHN